VEGVGANTSTPAGNRAAAARRGTAGNRAVAAEHGSPGNRAVAAERAPARGLTGMDDEQQYQAAASKDPRFDGVFFIAVTSTGIYCRPSCPAITPKRENMRFYRSAAAAQDAGFRACKRCRPDASPGSPEWNARADVVGRAMRLIADGVVDRDGVEGLADRLGYEQRQVRRLVTAELGAGPLAIARAQRAQTARVLTETTALPLSEIAFAAGFASIRQFNATIREVFAVTPTQLREARGRRAQAPRSRRAGRIPGLHGPADLSDPMAPGLIRLRLPYRPPIDLDRMLGFLAARAIPGVESVESGRYRRTLMLPNGTGILAVSAGEQGGREPGYIECELQLEDLRDLTAAVQRCRRLLDLDADPEAVTGYLAGDPVLGPPALACPGRRAPGHVDGNELALRAVLGQQVSVAAARRLGARLVAAYGKPLERPEGSLTHCFPTAETLASADPATLPMPGARASALTGLAAALASGQLSLDPGAERDRAEAQLLAMPGVGPWTAAYIRMRALSDPDAFLPTDVGVLESLSRLGALPAGTAPTGAAARSRAVKAAAGLAEGWRPWRSYAVHHLWAHLEEGTSEDRNHGLEEMSQS
jgi:AraC family transcriptional regulator, regulatory protein of adaptative response / DNA-3-methyladenine glycosylase II